MAVILRHESEPFLVDASICFFLTRLIPSRSFSDSFPRPSPLALPSGLLSSAAALFERAIKGKSLGFLAMPSEALLEMVSIL